MSLADLRANLIEMNHAYDLRQDLVPSGNRVYHKAFSQGQWLCFWSFGSDLTPQLDQVLAQIKELFWSQIKILDEQKAIYFTHLADKLNKQPFHPDKMEKSRQQILHFCLHFKPLLRAVTKGETAPYLEFFKLNHHEEFKKLKSTCEAVRFCQRMADFEAVTESEIPLRILLKVASNKELTPSRSRHYEKWLEKVRSSIGNRIASFQGGAKNEFVQSRFLHRMLTNLVQFMQVHVPDHKAHLGVLEASLCEHKYKEVEFPDNKQLRWRDGMQKGEILQLGDQRFILGDILEAHADPRKPLVFAVEGDGSVQVEIYQNEAWYHLKEYEEELAHCGLMRAKVLLTERNGAVVIRERLYRPLSESDWTSDRNRLSAQDRITAEPIVELIMSLSKLPFTPYPLEPDKFLFNFDGEMRAGACLIQQPKSFEMLELLAFQCAFDSQNQFYLPVFLHLMHASQLSQTLEAKEYYDVVKKTLENSESVEVIASRNSNIKNKFIQELRKQVYYAIREVKAKCLIDLEEEYGLNGNYADYVDQAIKETYKKYCPGRIIEKDFYSRCFLKAIELSGNRPPI